MMIALVTCQELVYFRTFLVLVTWALPDSVTASCLMFASPLAIIQLDYVAMVTIFITDAAIELLYTIESTNCMEGDVRLVNGSFTTEGRVEVCSDGIWGTVCGKGFNAIDAYVVCKELGLGLSGMSFNCRTVSVQNCFRTNYIYQFLLWRWRWHYYNI